MPTVTLRNNQKYISRHWLKRKLFQRFLDHIAALLNRDRPDTVLDFGCGSAAFWEEMRPRLRFWPQKIHGVDQDASAVAQARARGLPNAYFTADGLEDAEIRAVRYDCVLCLEVLEHLERPEQWLEKLCGLEPRCLILSVPHEPWFCLSHLLSGNNWSRWGNDPDHVQHWSASGFRRFAAPYVDVASVNVSAFPFTVLLGVPRTSGA